jgi:Transposase DDE domain group 1
MPTECSRDLFGYEVVEGRQVVAAFDGGEVTSDAGALLLGATDRAIGLTARFAACFDDGRAQSQVEHSIAAMVAQRVFGIALGNEDLIDHDQLRHDPVLAALAGKLRAKRKGCAPLAGKSTLNRLEHAPLAPSRYHKIGHDAGAIEGLFVDLFLDSHATPPRRIILDLDATDDPLHGHQEGRFFHGYYDCYCYLPLYVFCGKQLLAAKLRRSNIDASAGAKDEVVRIVAQIRARWPRVEILLRADSGFARDELMAWCEANGVDYVFGLARNERLIGAIAEDLAAAELESLAQSGPARRFADLFWRTLDSWSRERRVVAKAEHLPKGPNPRFVVTSLLAAESDARAVYEDVYCARGEVENRIKEQGSRPGWGAGPRPRSGREPDLFADRTSAATMKANQLRLWFASFAYVLLDALRRIGLRHTQFAAATCGTIRLKLLKIGAQVQRSVRRIKVAMASACPYQTEYHLAYLHLKRAAF